MRTGRGKPKRSEKPLIPYKITRGLNPSTRVDKRATNRLRYGTDSPKLLASSETAAVYLAAKRSEGNRIINSMENEKQKEF